MTPPYSRLHMTKLLNNKLLLQYRYRAELSGNDYQRTMCELAAGPHRQEELWNLTKI